MDSVVQECPPLAQLLDMLKYSLPAAVQARSEQHFETCLRCQSLVDAYLQEAIVATQQSVCDSSFLPADDASAAVENVPPVTETFEAPYFNLAGATVSQHRLANRFDLKRMVGAGGFGMVFEAWDRELNRTVALKLPHCPLMEQADVRERFLIEGQAAARLSHPNIVPIFQSQMGEGHLIFLVAEFISGPSLEKWLRDHQIQGADIPITQAVEIALGLARGVAYAHLQNVLHRDLKPSNVLLVTDPDVPSRLIPRITDFGMARLMEQPTFSKSGSQLAGSIQYMAPELAWGTVSRASPQSDIFSLGCIFYELVTGHFAIESETLAGALDRLRTCVVISPSRYRRNLPRDIEIIILKCLQQEPTQRYTTATALVNDLQAYLNGQPIQARPISLAYRSLRWARRHYWMTSFCAVVLMAIILVAGQQHQHQLRLLQSTNYQQGLQSQLQQQQLQYRQRLQANDMRGLARDLREGLLNLAEAHMQPLETARAAEVRRGTALEFSWEILEKTLHGPAPLFTYRAHDGPVLSVAISPDSQHVASGDEQGNVHVWERTTGRCVANLKAHDNEVRALAFSPDGRYLATGGSYHWLWIWETARWQPVQRINAHNGTITALLWRADGTAVISGGRDGVVRENFLDTRRPATQVGVGEVITELQGISGSDDIFIGKKSGAIEQRHLEDADSATEIWMARPNELLFDFVMSSSKAWHCAARRRFEWQQRPSVTLGVNRLIVADMDAREQTIFLGADFGFLDVIRLNNTAGDGFLLNSWKGHSQNITALAVSRNGHWGASSSRDGTVKIWSLQTLPLQQRWIDSQLFTASVAFSPNDELLAAQTLQNGLHIFTIDRGTHLAQLPTKKFDDLAPHPQFADHSGQLLTLTTEKDRGLMGWNWASHQTVRPLFHEVLQAMVLSKTGQKAVFLNPGTPGIWLTSWEDAFEFQNQKWSTPLQLTQDPANEISHVTISEDGRYAAYFRYETGEVVWINLKTCQQHRRPVVDCRALALAFAPEGHELLVWTDGSFLMVFDTHSGAEKFSRMVTIPRNLQLGLVVFQGDDLVLLTGHHNGDGQGRGILYSRQLGEILMEFFPSLGNKVGLPALSHDQRVLAIPVMPGAEKGGGIMLWFLPELNWNKSQPFETPKKSSIQ